MIFLLTTAFAHTFATKKIGMDGLLLPFVAPLRPQSWK